MPSIDTTSYWIKSARLPRFPKIENDVSVDVAVIGGGITGITAAYLLKQAGAKVALLERARCATVDTGHTTAHLTCVTDLRFRDMVKSFGSDAARAVWDAGAAARDKIVDLIRAEDIECDFRWVPGFLHAPPDDPSPAKTSELKREAKVVAELGIQSSFETSIPYFNVPGIRFPHQALFHPRRYLSALLRRLDGGGSFVFENSEVGEVSEKRFAVKVGDFEVRCRYLVIATHTPLMGKSGMVGAMLFQTKLALYTSYAVAAKVPSDSVPEALFWDTKDPYDYLRVEKRRGYDLAIFGGEDHKTGQEKNTEAPFRRLEKRFARLFPASEIEHRWSGQVVETVDGLPFIGETEHLQFAATGFAGNGMTFGTLGAMMATDAVLNRKNPWAALFDPNRKKVVGGAWRFLKENKDYPYYLLRDWLGGAEAKTLRAVKRNQGKIINLSGRKVAAYRDAEGKVSLCSPVCTHLQCIVGWNDAEQTWDCPCHGSRFKPTGEVISGPAEEPLEKISSSGNAAG